VGTLSINVHRDIKGVKPQLELRESFAHLISRKILRQFRDNTDVIVAKCNDCSIVTGKKSAL
jgi:hypothetical protein